MSNIKPTREAVLLNDALSEVGVETQLEHWDGHKHIDIYVPLAKLYIEIDGMNHYTDVRQVLSDFQRDYYSEQEGFRTLRIPAQVINQEINKIVNVVRDLVDKKLIR